MKAILLICGMLVSSIPLFSQSPAKPAPSYSGTYSFLKDGEFVQITIEDDGRVTGFISRYGESESDRGLFLDHFFKKDAKLDGNKLSFSTEAVHATAYDFNGTIERGDGKTPTDEGYYVAKGTLIQTSTVTGGKTTTQSRSVVFRSFPQDAEDTPEKKN
jgi:hypothetical protein